MPITPQEALLRCIEHREIFHDEMLHLFRQIMSGEMSPTMIAALTLGLRVKKETIGEIAAAAQVMREFSTKVPMADTTNLLDIVGTGGDGAHTFNISTASMFVAAAAGARVAKHGGRSVSSSSGSADVIESLGANINLKPEQIAQSIAQTGIGFMFAPNHHAAMKYAAPVQRLGAQHAMVVYGRDNMDEVSLGAATMVGELVDGEIREYEIHPEDYGLQMIASRNLKVANAAESKAMMMEALTGEPGAAYDIVALNAGTALYAAGVAGSIEEGLAKARAAILSGAARAKVDQFVQVTQQLGQG
jgi:anthranilate phosphoribosyltransferase